MLITGQPAFIMTGQPGKALTPDERQHVERLLDEGHSVTTIHPRTGHSRSLIRIIIAERRQRVTDDQSAQRLADEIWPDE